MDHLLRHAGPLTSVIREEEPCRLAYRQANPMKKAFSQWNYDSFFVDDLSLCKVDVKKLASTGPETDNIQYLQWQEPGLELGSYRLCVTMMLFPA